MSDNSRDESDTEPAKSFDEWLDRQAESEGIPREELFERVVSSYWTLTEVVQLLDGSNEESAAESLNGLSGSGRDGGSSQDIPKAVEGNETRSGEISEADLEELREKIETLQDILRQEVERRYELEQRAHSTLDRLDSIEEDLEHTRSTSAAAHESLSDRLDNVEGEFNERHDQLQSWLDSEFANLQTIIEYLITQTDSLERTVTTIETEHKKELDRLRSDHEQLASLTEAAADKGVHSGICTACEETIDLALLARPYCPGCGARLLDVETESRWLVFSKTSITAAAEGGSEADPERTTRRDEGHATSPPTTAGEREGAPTSRRDRTGTQSPTSDTEPSVDIDAIGDAGPDRQTGKASSSGADTERKSGESVGEQPDAEAASGESPFGDLSDLTDDEYDDTNA